MATSQHPPPLQILGKFSSSSFIFLSLSIFSSLNFLPVRGSDGFSIWNGPPFIDNQPTINKLDKVACTSTKFSEDGSKLLVTKSETLTIYECRGFGEIKSFEVPNLLAAALSPCGTYLQTFQKSSTPQEKNVVLWKVDTGGLVYSQFQKNMTKVSW